MDTIKFDKKNVLMVAHRGLSGLEKENTLPAFIAAGNRSYYGIETDVHKTADGKYVVFHDDDTSRVAGDKLVVEESSFDGLRGLYLKDIDGRKGRPDLRIPTLAEYIDVCKRYEKICVLELKNHYEQNDIDEILDIINKAEYLDGVIFISFDHTNLVCVRNRYPEHPVQYLTSKLDEEVYDILIKNKFDLDIHHKQVNADMIERLHSQGIKVNCWTCNEPEDGERYAAMGVDYITTNILE